MLGIETRTSFMLGKQFSYVPSTWLMLRQSPYVVWLAWNSLCLLSSGASVMSQKDVSNRIAALEAGF